MSKGFTLIELLAVIVILAIIATIATPIILSMIEDTKESATLRSAEYYLEAVETSVAAAILKNTNINDGTYNILENGNICLEGYDQNTNTCGNELVVEVKGEKPELGKINIYMGRIKDVMIVVNNKTIATDKEGALVYVDTSLRYTTGQEVTFNPGDVDRTWNVIDEDATTVTLMLSENLGEVVAWYAYSNHNSQDNGYGPKDVLEYLNELTKEWDNVNPIENYSYINNLNGTEKPYGYQKLEIKNGVTKLTHKKGEIITQVDGISRARLITLEEIFELASKKNTNLTENNLRKFIERNLGAINTVFETALTTVDEAIAYVVQMEDDMWHRYEREVYQIYYTVWKMINKYSIEATYDVRLPEYLYKNLYSGKHYLYWFLSSYNGHSFFAWGVDLNGHIGVDYVFNDGGVRPVITVSKSKL